MRLVALLVGVSSLFISSIAGGQMARPDSAAQAAADETIVAYAAAWNEADVQARDRLLERAWAAAGAYTDPTAHVEGREALAQHIAGYLKSQAGAGTRIVPASRTDVHHNQFRFGWKIVRGDGTVAMEGIDFGTFDADGRINRIVGFFGPMMPKTP